MYACNYKNSTVRRLVSVLWTQVIHMLGRLLLGSWRAHTHVHQQRHLPITD